MQINKAGEQMNEVNFKTIEDKNLFPIVPLNNYCKIPIVKWGNKENWIKNVQAINIYLNKLNKDLTGFSLLTGKHSNIMVVDIDKNHGNCLIDGLESFKELIKDFSNEDKEKIFNTYTVKTPRGGTHLYFKYEEGLKNKANYVEGVDIRTDGGLIVLPNSKVNVENEIKEYLVLNDTDINEMPQVLFQKFMELDKSLKKQNTNIVRMPTKVYKEGCRNDELFRELVGIISKSSIRDINTITSIASGLNLLKCNPPLDDSEVDCIIGSVNQRLNPPYCNEKGNVIEYLLVQHVIEKQPSYKKGNLWFLYDDKQKFYRYMEYEEVQKMFFKYAINDTDKTTLNAKKFADLLMISSEDCRQVQDEKTYINCFNGIINVSNNKLLKHDPKYKTEIQFKANLITDIKEWEKRFDKSDFKNFLYGLVDDESMITLQESWGLMLSPHAREVQNCFIYKGEGSNGKSALFDIQEALIGDNEYISSIGLGDFGGDFIISSAEGKHVNIVRDDELNGAKVDKFFKSMCCGEPVAVNRKNKNIIRLGFNISMFFGLNRMPNTLDKSTGFFRRPIIIPFNNSFGTEKEVKQGLRDIVKDPEIAKRIIENELDIVFTWAYYGLIRLKNNKWQVTVSEASEKEMDEYRQEVDSAYSFYREKVTKIPNKDVRIPKKEVYKIYMRWCDENDIKPMNPTHFGRGIASLGVKSKKSNSVGYYLDIEVADLELISTKEKYFK